LVQNGSVGRLDDQIVQTSDFKSSHLY